MEAEKIYVDDILSDEDDECPSPIIPKKYIEKEEFESRKSKLDIKKIISSFILKKEYFVSHKKTDIHVDYDLEKEPLGEGAFGVVYRATERETGIIRAAKKIQVKDDSDIENFYREVGALKTLDHPNVIKLYEVYEDKEEGFVYLIEEYCEGGELFDYIIDHNGLEEKEAARVFHQMLSSILYWHKNCICHRDLKPDNFMLSKRGKRSPIKLIDFGLSRQFFSYNENKGVDYVRMATRAGTKLYMAPEVFTGNYSNACDIWSLGVILFIMVSSEIPFKGSTEEQIKQSILDISYDFDKPIWDNISEEWKDLISQMIVEESQRITPKKALHHPWFKKFLFKKKKMLGADSSHIEKIENFKDSNHLKKAILTFLSAKASDEDIKEEIELFNNYDTNNDGYITKKELKKGMTKLHNFTNDDIEKFMESMDTDKNGAINFNEFISATLNNKISTDYSRIVKAFEFFDLDNDGQIDKKELQEALTGKSFEMIDMQIFEGVIDECDKDRDGKINFEEFSQTVSNKLDIKTKQKLSEYGKPAETP